MATHQAPVYVVHSTQAAAVERAQALLSQGIVDPERRAALADALKGFAFAPGFGQSLAKLLRAGYAIHEVPIRYTPRTQDEGKKIGWIDGLEAIYTLLRCRFAEK